MSLATTNAQHVVAERTAHLDGARAVIADLTERLHRERVLRKVWHDRAVRAGVGRWRAGAEGGVMSEPYDTERAETEMRRPDLRAAADKLRRLAEVATPNVCPEFTRSAVRHIARNVEMDCPHHEDPDDCVEWDRYDDAPFIAAMSPTVGLALAAWLDAEAELCDDPKNHAEPSAAAVAIAAALIPTPVRQTNGEEKR